VEVAVVAVEAEAVVVVVVVVLPVYVTTFCRGSAPAATDVVSRTTPTLRLPPAVAVPAAAPSDSATTFRVVCALAVTAVDFPTTPARPPPLPAAPLAYATIFLAVPALVVRRAASLTTPTPRTPLVPPSPRALVSAMTSLAVRAPVARRAVSRTTLRPPKLLPPRGRPSCATSSLPETVCVVTPAVSPTRCPSRARGKLSRPEFDEIPYPPRLIATGAPSYSSRADPFQNDRVPFFFCSSFVL